MVEAAAQAAKAPDTSAQNVKSNADADLGDAGGPASG
jgi:hypothetical protein